MNLLAIDTATEACSAALDCDGRLLERYELAPRQHTRLILPMIEALLAEAGIGFTQLDAIAFGRGPGAFVGLRIAASIAQGLAFAGDLPVAPVSTLAALARLAWRERGEPRVLAALDARMGEIYAGAYCIADDGAPVSLSEERVLPPAALEVAGAWFGVGSGWDAYAESLAVTLECRGWLPAAMPRAADIAVLGRQVILRGEGVAAELAQPVYLRDEVAKKLAEQRRS